MIRFFRLFFLCVLLAPSCAIWPLENRLCAEWEPAIGVMITWPLSLPKDLIMSIAEEDTLYVLVADSNKKRKARQCFKRWGVRESQVKFCITSVESEWTRDYGAHQVFDCSGRLTVVDPIYINTPIFFAEHPKVGRNDSLNYFGESYPGDDKTNRDVADMLGLVLRKTPCYLTGGNFLTDGHKTAFTTRAMLDENNVLRSDEAFLKLVEEFTGVNNVIVMENTEDTGIQHIDCWLKVLDEETLLIKKAPEDHPEHARIERNVLKLQKLKSRYGRPYKIVRIECPPYQTAKDPITGKSVDMLPAYTNSLILNKRVFVPLFGGPGDEAALDTYRKSLPNYKVLGFTWKGWRSFDALHCRTRGVFDPQMLKISHARILNNQEAGRPIIAKAFFYNYSDMDLKEDALLLCWRLAGEAVWRCITMVPSDEDQQFEANIPAQAPGARVEYYIHGEDDSGRKENLPITAPGGFYTFSVKS